MWDKLVFKSIQDGMGGRLRLMVVGSAPLAGNVLTFARCALGCLIVEGYGQTECCAPITLTIQVRQQIIKILSKLKNVGFKFSFLIEFIIQNEFVIFF